jgi:DNA-binding MarR family transcriptional regulator
MLVSRELLSSDRIDEINDVWTRELPGLVNEHSALAKRITSLSGEIERVIDIAVSAQGLTVAEYDILVALRRQGEPFELSPVQISRELLLSSGGTSNALRRLRERGLVDASISTTDRRSRSITLTAAGVQLAEAALRDSVAAQTRLLSGIPEPLVHRAIDALRDVAANLRTHTASTR